jgi:hypothetical protein
MTHQCRHGSIRHFDGIATMLVLFGIRDITDVILFQVFTVVTPRLILASEMRLSA